MRRVQTPRLVAPWHRSARKHRADHRRSFAHGEERRPTGILCLPEGLPAHTRADAEDQPVSRKIREAVQRHSHERRVPVIGIDDTGPEADALRRERKAGERTHAIAAGPVVFCRPDEVEACLLGRSPRVDDLRNRVRLASERESECSFIGWALLPGKIEELSRVPARGPVLER